MFKNTFHRIISLACILMMMTMMMVMMIKMIMYVCIYNEEMYMYIYLLHLTFNITTHEKLQNIKYYKI